MAKTATVVYQTLSAVEITLCIAPCIAIHALTYDDAPLCGIAIRIAMLGSRYDMRIAGPSIAMHRCIITTLIQSYVV